MEHKEAYMGLLKGKKKKEDNSEQTPQKRRIVVQPEEKAKRGRWITLLVLFLTLFFGYVFWRT